MDRVVIFIRYSVWIGADIAGIVMLIKAIRRKKSKRNAIIAFIIGLTAFITISKPSGESSIKFDDNAILRFEGHPTYYGSTAKAHEVWDKVEKGKIVFADSNSKYSDSVILMMHGRGQGEKNELIRDIEIYLKNMDDSVERTLDGALDLASEYLPYDIINRWYEFGQSYCLVPEADNQKKDNIYYVVEYHLTEAGSDAYYAGAHKYSGSMDIIIDVSRTTNEVQYITIGFGTPRWFSSLRINDYEQIDWEYNFIK